jgi:cytochrome o ubiquinol oxidase subunit III
MSTHPTSTQVPLGLWVYIMSDCVLFAALFASYAVLHDATAGGVMSHELFDRQFVFIETVLLLASSFSCGLAYIASRAGKKMGTWIALLITLLLGLGFLGMELSEFAGLIAEGHGWNASAFLSSYFTLVGTHGLHVFVGTLWLLALFIHLAVGGMTKANTERILYFSLFWHFLDIVWICIFSLVYLFGTL